MKNYENENQTIIEGSIIAAIYALVMAVAVWLIKIFIRKKEGEVQIIGSICFDALMVWVDAISNYLTLAKYKFL